MERGRKERKKEKEKAPDSRATPRPRPQTSDETPQTQTPDPGPKPRPQTPDATKSIAEPPHAAFLSGGARPSDRRPSDWRADLGLDCGAIERGVATNEEINAPKTWAKIALTGVRGPPVLRTPPCPRGRTPDAGGKRAHCECPRCPRCGGQTQAVKGHSLALPSGKEGPRTRVLNGPTATHQDKGPQCPLISMPWASSDT